MSSATKGRIARGEPVAWVKMPSEEELLPMMADHPYTRGFVPAMGRLLASHPRIGPAFAALYQQIMFPGEGALTRQEREMVAGAATAAQDCFY